MDKLRAMRFFCRAVEMKSFSAAAHSLEVVPSALSKVVAALEDDLGFPLLNRSTRGLSLTDGGAAYFEQCRQILGDIENAEALGRSGVARTRGTLRIGLHPALRFDVMMGLGPFLDDHPDLRIETITTNSPAAVIDEGIDIVLHLGLLPDSTLMAKQLGWVRPIVCASPGYLAARGVPLHPTDLIQHRAIVHARRDEDPNVRWTFAKGTETCEVEVPGNIIVRDGIGLIDAAIGGGGVTRLSDIAARRVIATGALRTVLDDWKGARKAITAVMPPHGRPAAAKVRIYLDYVTALLRDTT